MHLPNVVSSRAYLAHIEEARERDGQMQTELAISVAALIHWRTITYGARPSEMANLSNLWGVGQVGHLAQEDTFRDDLADDRGLHFAHPKMEKGARPLGIRRSRLDSLLFTHYKPASHSQA
jgi:hypothetical protein